MISSPRLRPAEPMATPAAAPINRFLGLTADSTNPRPNDFTGVKLSMAVIHFGVACSPPRPRQFRTPTSSSRTPRTIFVQDAAADGSPADSRDPDSAVKIAVTTTIPAIQPTRNPLLVPAARGENSIRMAAMSGIGEIATPRASGRRSPITPFIGAPGRAASGVLRPIRSRGDDGERRVSSLQERQQPTQRRRVSGVLDPGETAPAEQTEQLGLGQGDGQVCRDPGPRVLGLDERAVGQGQPQRGAAVGELPLDDQGFCGCPGSVDPDREGIEELLDGEGAGHTRAEVPDRQRLVAFAKLECAGEVEVT